MGLLEQLLAALNANTEALNAHTAALGGAAAAPAAAAAAPAADKKPAGGKKATAPDKKPEAAQPKHSVEEVKAAAVAVKEKFGSPAAKELIANVGKADELKNIKPENYDAFVKACSDKVSGSEEEAQEEDDL